MESRIACASSTSAGFLLLSAALNGASAYPSADLPMTSFFWYCLNFLSSTPLISWPGTGRLVSVSTIATTAAFLSVPA